MRIIIICILGIITFFSVMVNVLFVANAWSGQAHAATTENLVTANDFTDGTWSGTNLSTRHGDNVIAGVDNQYVESQISLSDHLLKPEINDGFTVNSSANVWFWNDSSGQSVTNTLKVTSSDGDVVEQNLVASGSCSTWNGCGYGSMGTNSVVVGTNTVDDYDITTTFTFAAPGTTGHYGADLKDPSLTVTYQEYTFDLDMTKIDDMKEFDYTFDDDFKTFDLFEDVEFGVNDEKDFFTQDYGDFDSDMKYEELPMESFEDEKIDAQYKEPSESSEEDFKDEPLEEKQQLVDEEIFFDEEQDLEPTPIDQEFDDFEQNVDQERDIEVAASFEDILIAEVNKIEVIISSQPILIDRLDFYAPQVLYDDQITYVDNRVIYDVVYDVFDPIVEYENRVRENKEKQQQLIYEIRVINDRIN